MGAMLGTDASLEPAELARGQRKASQFAPINSCLRELEGTGFLFAPEEVLTPTESLRRAGRQEGTRIRTQSDNYNLLAYSSCNFHLSSSKNHLTH